jgi:DNA-binding MarR family transcriptional regulator
MLLEVSLLEGISMSDLGRSLNMGQGSVSKNVKLLSQFIDDGQLRGFGLLSTEQDLAERRRFIVHTTGKGKAFLGKLSNVLDFATTNGIEKGEAA